MRLTRIFEYLRPHSLGRARGAVRSYVLAVAVTGFVLLAKLFLARYQGVDSPFVLFPFSVLIVSWYGGVGPGILAALLSVFLTGLFFIQPHGQLVGTAQALEQLLGYAGESALFCWFAVVMHRTRERLHRSNEEFEAELRRREEAEAALKRENEAVELERRRLQAVLGVLPVGVILVDAEGTITDCNAAAEAIWKGEIPRVGMDRYHVFKTWESASKNPVELHERGIVRALMHQEVVASEELDIECFDGSRKTILNYDAPIWNTQGVLSGAVAVNVDITERRQTERQLEDLTTRLEERVDQRTRALVHANERLGREVDQRRQAEEQQRRSEERFQKAFQLGPVAMAITDGLQQYVDVNEAFCTMVGLSHREVVGRTAAELGLQIEPAFGGDAYPGGDVRRRDLEYRVRTRDGRRRDVLVSAGAIDIDGHICTLSIFQDITDRKILEREVLEIGERERQRLAREMHDDLGQQLTGITFLSQGLHHILEEENSAHAERAKMIRALLGEALKSARRLSARLSPVAVEAADLGRALVDLGSNVSQVFGVTCKVDTAVPLPELDGETATHLFRIAQEAVNNAVKHGCPQRLQISLTRCGREAWLRVEDDGIGFDPASETGAGGMGLRTMQYRADLIGGELSIERASGGGMIVACRFGTDRGIHRSLAV